MEKKFTMRTQSSATENTYKTILEFIHVLRCVTSRMGPNDLYFVSLKFMGRLLSWNVDCTYWLTSKEGSITEEMIGMSVLKLGYKAWLPQWVSLPVFSLSSPDLGEASYCFRNSRKERLMWPGIVSTPNSYQELKAHQNTRVRLAGEPFPVKQWGDWSPRMATCYESTWQGQDTQISTSAPLTMWKPLTLRITKNYGKFLEMGIPDHLTFFLRNLCTGQDMEQGTGSKLEKEYIKSVYCHLVYLTSMQSTSCKMLGWMKHKLKSRLLGEI